MNSQIYDKIQKYVNQKIKKENFKKAIVLEPTNKLDNFTWGEWQIVLKLMGARNQNFICPACGSLLNNKSGELHHALLTRGDVMGNKQKELIHHTYNCLVLHPNCHKTISKKESTKLLFYLYGKPIIDWYFNFPTKWSKPNIFVHLERMLEIE